MVGYGSEDQHFVVELTYNYGVKSYLTGNDFQVNLVSYVMKGQGCVCMTHVCFTFTSILPSTPNQPWKMQGNITGQVHW